jgi:hypothetical protein
MSDGPTGYHVTCDDAQCTSCFERLGGHAGWLANGGFESWTDAPTIFTNSESDSPTHCHECGRLIAHDLTDAGLRYVAESVLQGFTEGKQNPVTVQWIKAYGDQIPDELDDVPGSMSSALVFYTWLPIDRAWLARDDLRQHAMLAGWCAEDEQPQTGAAVDDTPTVDECRVYFEAINSGRRALGWGPRR